MAERPTTTIAGARGDSPRDVGSGRTDLADTTIDRAERSAPAEEVRVHPVEVDAERTGPPAEPVPIIENEVDDIPRRDEEAAEEDRQEAAVDLTDERPTQTEPVLEVGPLEGAARPEDVQAGQSEELSVSEDPAVIDGLSGREAPSARPAAEDTVATAEAPEAPRAEAAPTPQAPAPGPGAEPTDFDPTDLDDVVLEAESRRSDDSEVDSMDIADAVLPDEVEFDIVPERPDGFDADPGLGGGAATEHQQDLLPSDEEREPSDDDEEGLRESVDLGPDIDIGVDGGSGEATDDDPFNILPDLDGTIDPGNLTDHEQGILDDLSGDAFENPLDNPVTTGEEVPDEYDLSGNETGDGPSPFTSIHSTKDYVYVEGEGLMPRESGKPNPDFTTVGEQRAEYVADRAAEQAKEESKAEEDYYGDGGVLDWVASWFKDEPGTDTETDDYDPDSAPAPKSPTMDPEIADTHFGIGVEAKRTGEIQYADMPEDGDGEAAEYDGVDYGEEYTEPQFDIADAEEMIYIDAMDGPDVDPLEDDNASEADLSEAAME